MGKMKRLLILYEEKNPGPGYFDVQEIVSVLGKIKNKDVKIRSYSFKEYIEKDDDGKFLKALIICKDDSNLSQKLKSLLSKFDIENAIKFRVLVKSTASLPQSDLQISKSNIIYTTNPADVALWWPRVLFSLFPRKRKQDKVLSCLFLFDGDASSQNQEELTWFVRMRMILRQLGMKCLWVGALGDKLVHVVDKSDKNLVLPETVKPHFLVILSRNDGEEMFKKTGYQIRRKIKTLVLTDNKKSRVCKCLARDLEKVFIYETEDPMNLDLLGWACLLRELKLVMYRDAVFTRERKVKKLVFLVTLLVTLFIVLPIYLAILATVCTLALTGQKNKLIQLFEGFCAIRECCQTCAEPFLRIPCCFLCCGWLDCISDEAYPRRDEEVLEAIEYERSQQRRSDELGDAIEEGVGLALDFIL